MPANAQALPRVATLTHAQRPATRGSAPGSSNDRFSGIDSIYKKAEGPSALAYADAAASSTLGKGPAASLSLGPSDRFAGHDSRYKKGLRKSTMPIHDPKVYAAKQVDTQVPLPAVAVNVPAPEKREIKPSNERFGSGADSFYSGGGDGPAPTKYDATLNQSMASSTSASATAWEKQQSERFNSHDSIYTAAWNGAPKVTAYDRTKAQDVCKSATSTLVTPFESGNADRFAGHDSRYKRGLRRSTVPEARDPTSFPAAQGINKRGGAARGAALKAALKATISGASRGLGAVAESDEPEELKENVVEAEA